MEVLAPEIKTQNITLLSEDSTFSKSLKPVN